MNHHASEHSNRSNSKPKTVLIVDDSRVMRAWLRAVLSEDPRLEVVGEACDAVEARDFLRARPVDVMTLDIEMPGMSGLEFLTRVMRSRPMPVVMMSSMTSAGSEAAIQALSRGAIDCMVKPKTGFGPEISRDICERVYQAACSKQVQYRRVKPAPAAPAASVSAPDRRKEPCQRGHLILIGASTGGVAAIETLLPDLDPDGPPVVIVQHMPGNFLVSFTERLNRQVHQHVRLAEEGVPLCRGDIVVAPGNDLHTTVSRKNGLWRCVQTANETGELHCPSVDILFKSAVSEARNVSAAILTGLGRDGAEGLRQLSENGASTFGQNEDTCVVYGMPRAARSVGAVQKELPLERIGGALNNSFEGRRSRRPIVTGEPKR